MNKIKVFVKGLLVVSSLSLSQLSFGQTGSGPNPYSDCGLGAAIFPSNGVAAAISNVIWDLGTTALTSATASPETCSGSAAAAAAYILESYDSLVEETAKGSGDNLTALLEIVEISESQTESVVKALRSEVANTISHEAYIEMSSVEKAEAFYLNLVSVIQQAG